jgi:hypothetical protein
MKKVSILLAAILVVGLFAGCGKFTSDTNALYIKKDGTIEAASIETFDKDYYEDSELETFIDDEISAYESSGGSGTVKKDSFQIKDGTASLYMTYSGWEAYAAFNEKTLYTGTVADAIAAGYSMDDVVLIDAETAKLSLDARNASGDAATDASADASADASDEAQQNAEVKDHVDYKVVITDEDNDIKVDGTVLYVSDVNATVTADDMVTIEKEEGDLSLTYIIYE